MVRKTVMHVKIVNTANIVPKMAALVVFVNNTLWKILIGEMNYEKK